jgi:6-phosphogluconate dehydrogenase (decarboxylating)
MSNVGFIGLGIMGKPMAANLMKGGHTLYLYNRSGVAPELTAAGGKACASAKDVAQKAEIIITMVPDTPDVDTVLFGKEGAAEGLSAGKILVDMSSISPIETKTFAERIRKAGAEYMDAPVSGGEVGAKNAALTIMAGGNEPVFARVKPLFELGAGSSRRADDQAHLRSGVPHRTAPERSQPRARFRTCAQDEPAQYRNRAGTVQRLPGAGWGQMGSLGDGQGAGSPGQPSGRQVRP